MCLEEKKKLAQDCRIKLERGVSAEGAEGMDEGISVWEMQMWLDENICKTTLVKGRQEL